MSIERGLDDIETEISRVPWDQHGGCLPTVHAVSGAERRGSHSGFRAELANMLEAAKEEMLK